MIGKLKAAIFAAAAMESDKSRGNVMRTGPGIINTNKGKKIYLYTKNL